MRNAEFWKTGLAIIAGACYSSALVAPSPLWQLALAVSTMLVMAMRMMR